jgi:hypothetical protein
MALAYRNDGAATQGKPVTSVAGGRKARYLVAPDDR